MAMKGRYFPINPEKYLGNLANIEYRSQWERATMFWLDRNSFVEKWGSEITIIPYQCKTDGKKHRYFMDFTIHFANGKKFLIEVKPEVQTMPPIKKNQRKLTFLKEVLTYSKNVSKWQSARIFADKYGYTFNIWTEHQLKTLGILL